jgi:cobalamin biosynthesis Mg chelatase CobN
MSEEFSEEFVVEEEATSASRPFLIAAGSLIALFIVLMACVLGAVLVRQNASSERAQQIADIENANATTMAQNALVTQTVAAQLTIQAQPTNTPRPPATATNLPSPTPSPTSPPTNTPTPEPEEPTETPPAAQATSDAGPGAAGSTTATATAGGAGTGATGSPTTVSGEASSTLPETGASPLSFVAIALALVAVLIVSRRLRTA